MSVGLVHICSCLDQFLECIRMSWSSISKNNRLNERCPTQIIDMIKWCSGMDKNPHNLCVTQVCGSNKGGTIITAGDVFRAPTEHQGGVQGGDIISYRRDGDNIVTVIFQRVWICPGTHQHTHCLMMPPIRSDMKRRASVAIPDIRFFAFCDQCFYPFGITTGGGGHNARIL